MNRHNRTLVVIVIVWWTLNGLAGVAETVTMRDAAGEEVALVPVLRASMASAWMWVPLTLGLFATVRRWPLEPGRILVALTAQSAAVALVLLLRPVLVVVLNGFIGWYEQVPGFTQLLVHSVWNNLFLGWLIVAAAHAVLFAERARERERLAVILQNELAQQRLESLSARLNPHFLFNSLNSIAELVQRDADAAERAIVGLGMLLRRSLEIDPRQQVPLHEEVAFLRHYLDIEKLRLGERLSVHWSIDAETRCALVPHLVLQPIVENAIRHGISRQSSRGNLAIRARRCDDRLVLEVEDDGTAIASEKGFGLGISATRARLQSLFAGAGDLELSGLPHGGTRARLSFPFLDQGAAA